MDGTRRDDRTLGRIVAMLVALAALAERAAGRSLPVRWLVLSLLRRAETAAHDLVAGVAGSAWPGPEVRPETGYGPADAASLALRLRMLAAVLGALLPPAGRRAQSESRAGAASRLFSGRQARLPAMPCGPARAAPDTS